MERFTIDSGIGWLHCELFATDDGTRMLRCAYDDVERALALDDDERARFLRHAVDEAGYMCAVVRVFPTCAYAEDVQEVTA